MTDTRQLAFTAIDEELGKAGRWFQEPHEIAQFAAYIQSYSDEIARRTTAAGNPYALESALHHLRHIAALAVAGMEQHGVRRP